ncbi:NAD(P)-dependent alcohol dehydrogenase [Paraliomyxa miuraensis]|uniref:NAD(P)-dependent alcohol dehydrogenase n=1 Tax=Paraliomyxa miuraensis TaxID=376150 RepID=UPI00225BE5DB|nr:NAD(P)-dependent alcohol dehydrogenase [Paraliomyxa miuraensis]MCX4247969.1 NAD(P)-dependent alcohol dehydrogenase [Paraliomyxa miuraensis]
MKAVVWTSYGPPEVLRLQEVPDPVAGTGEVLVRVHATSVSTGDCEMRSLALPLLFRLPLRLYVGFWRPRRVTVLGQELAGEIVEVGEGVTGFAVGDRVFVATDFGLGGYAELRRVPIIADGGAIARQPANVDHATAAIVPLGGLEALYFLRKAELRAGERVLINGAGGSIGTFGVQLARHYGAEVTAVDHGDKLPMLRSIGADHVIDYTREDFTRRGETYDVIFDVVGRSPFRRSVRALRDGGRYVLPNFRVLLMLRGWWVSLTSRKRLVLGTASRTTAELIELRELIEAGAIRPVLDRSFALEEIVQAHRYVEAGRKQGGVAITVVR